MGLDNPLHIAFVLVILLLVFGAKRLPELGRSLGAGMRGFKESISGETESSERVDALGATPVAPASNGSPAEHVPFVETLTADRPSVRPVA